MEFIAAFIVFGLFFAFLALGLILKQRPLKGTCGGLNQFKNGSCDICGATAESGQNNDLPCSKDT